MAFASSTTAHVPSLPTSAPRDVEPVLRQQLIEVVAGDPPRNVRKALADQCRVPIANALAAGA